jgi:hypothetical protein
MTTMTKEQEREAQAADAGSGVMSTETTNAPGIDSEVVWNEVEKGSFAIISYVTPSGKPRSSGVMYKAVDHRLYVVVAPDSWKARHIALNDKVALTVPVRRGGLLSLVFPIPPATISFHGRAVVHAGDSPRVQSVVEQLRDLLPADRRDASSVIEIAPEGSFVTYGIGVSLNAMRDPHVARARAPVM